MSEMEQRQSMESGTGPEELRTGRKKRGGFLVLLIFIAALAVFGYSAYKLYGIHSGYEKGEEEYEELAEIATEQEEDRFRVDFDALREINPDVVAWIRFEEPAIINYPVVQGRDNEEYLENTFRGYDNTVGTLFVNVYNHPDFNDLNTIIYGHHMNNGTMFNQLEAYKSKEHWEKYPYFYIYTPDGAEIKYKIYAAGVVKDTSIGYTYQFADTNSYKKFQDETRAASNYDTGVELGMDSQIVTLSTCTVDSNDDRMIVHGVKVDVKY